MLMMIMAVLYGSLFVECISTSPVPSKKQFNQEILLLDPKNFDATVDGKQVHLYTLKNGNVTIQVTNFGGRVTSIFAPDKNGAYEDVVLGYENIGRYVNYTGERFVGPIVGRYANRIAKGQFELDGVTYHLPINSGGQTLHGGLKGLDLVVWDVDEVTETEIHLSYLSPDGSDGFPGTVLVQVVYTLTSDNELKIEYTAVTDKPTVINLTNHAMFNLKGEGNGPITDHILTINSSYVTTINSDLIPTGEISSVDRTPLDFRTATVVGDRINDSTNTQMRYGNGYDHNWIVDRKTENGVEFFASVLEPKSGRYLEVFSDQPAMQFYSGNGFDGKTNGKTGKPQRYREAFAIETQKYPDSPNHPGFPTTRLNPGEMYTQTCVYKFSTKK